MPEQRQKFIAKAREIHGDRYDYDQFVYKDGRTKGTIICKEHGPFEKDPEHHIHRRQGCKACSNLAKSERCTSTTEEFITKAREIHGDQYDYGEFCYVRNTVKGKIRCKLHNFIFEQSPAHHLSGHCACPQCIEQKSRETQLGRYGAEHHSKTTEFSEKVRRTSLERFGVEHHSQTADFLDEMKRSNLERYGVEFASQAPEFQAQVRHTSFERFGMDHWLKAPEIRSKIVQTNLDRYGVANVRQTHIPLDSLETLNDKQAIIRLLETHSVREVARSLGVSDCTLGRYCYDHGIDLPASSYEAGISEFLRQYTSSVRLHDRSIIAPLEIDIMLDDRKIGIEFCGIYWHGELCIPDKNYHLNKLQQMQGRGYRLITIFEDEWLHKRSIVESRLLNVIGHSERGKGARQLTVRAIRSMLANSFLELHHIQGAGTAGFARYGAFDDEQLVAVMTFSRPRVALGRTSGADELLRFATDGRNYPGIASRLFQTFVREHHPDRVISYADRRWSQGRLYERLGFKSVHETKPNYWYTDRNKIIREYRFNYRKDRIKHLVEHGDEKTERQIMTELGRDRIWDCGSLKFEWSRIE